jgi:hypothetical protein
MMVLSDKCKKCNYTCGAIYFQQNFGNWTSGNNDIDKFIQDTQLLAHDDTDNFIKVIQPSTYNNVLEWIPYNRFNNIKYIKKIGVYKANWIDGIISYWDDANQNWERVDQNKVITLKSLNNTKNIKLEFINEVYNIFIIY